MAANRIRLRPRNVRTAGTLPALLLAGSLTLASDPGLPETTPPGGAKQSEESILVVSWPPNGAVVSATAVALVGRTSSATETLTVAGEPVELLGRDFFKILQIDDEGPNVYQLIATSA
ncbi:MAG: hypothetical protein GY835_09215, partial [bacterium]|nr:hypothetical protein [bacterium]